MSKPIIAIVGRPNVGKSTLFNKLIGERRSIVEDVPGVTRDRIYGETEWCGKQFIVIDTGGIEPKSDDIILSQMKFQAQVAVEDADGTVQPKIKISENVGKITNPHYKKLYRFFGNDTGKAIADYLCVYDEVVDDSQDMVIFDPEATWKTKTVYNFTAKELQVPIFKNGELVYKCPTLEEIRTYCLEQVDMLWDEVKRFDNPHTYYVDLSQKLWDIKYGLLKKNSSHEA